MKFFDYLKNFFFILIVLQITPPLIESIRKQYTSLLEPKTKIGLISIKGVLYDAGPYIKQFNTFFKDKAIKGILIKMDCSGSASGTGQTIHNELVTLKNLYPKPIGVMVENTCASGGYYIASAADYIVAPGMALIGSIGVCMPYFFQLREFIESYKLKTIPLKSGTYKNATDPFVDLSEQDKKLLQSLLDDSYQQFVADVAHNRHLAQNQSTLWADGKIFTGKQALELGLIDTVGSLHQALEIMKKKALIDGEIEFVQQSETTGLLSWFSSQQDPDTQNSLSTTIMDTVCTYLESRYKVQAHC